MNFENRNVSEIVDFIESHYHEGLRTLTPELLMLADKVERVHENNPSCPKGLYNLLSGIWMELQLHMDKEEKILFPMIRRGEFEHASIPIQVMNMEHNRHNEDLEAVTQFIAQHPLPADACRTWRFLYATLDKFVAELKEHIRLENEILFTRVLAKCS